MDLKSYLREQLREAHQLLETVVGDVTPDQLHRVPQGRALPMGAAYAHVIFSEDMAVHGLFQGKPALYQSRTATGASEPMANWAAGEDWSGYADWTKRTRFDLQQLRQYAQAVYAATDEWLASLTDEDLSREQNYGTGNRSLAWAIGRMLIAHVDQLTGEISAAKGFQGLQGYPF